MNPSCWLSLFLVLMVFFGARPAAFGTAFVQTNVFLLGPQESVMSDLWLMANRIRLAGGVRDDAFLLATTPSLFHQVPKDGAITLSGEFHNDVWAMGNTIDLTGTIHDHARLLARTITISGSIFNSAMFLGNTVHLTRPSDITADAWLVGENLIAEGLVEGDLNLIGKNVTLSGTFVQDVHVTAQDIVALPGTEIMGNLIYRSPTEFVPDSRVVIHGKFVRESIPEKTALSPSGFPLPSLLYQTGLFLGALMVGMLFMAAFPGFTGQAVRLIQCSFWKCLLTGLVTACLIPMASFLAMISIIGIPLSLLLVSVLMIMIYLSKIIVAISLGVWLMRRPEPRSYAHFIFPLVAGLLFIYAGVNSGLPGLVLWFMVIFVGTGGCVLTLFTGHVSLPEVAETPGSQSPFNRPFPSSRLKP